MREDIISERLYNRMSKKYSAYKVTRFLGTRGKTKVEYYEVKFKDTGNIIEAPLKTILEDRVVDKERKAKNTQKRARVKKKEYKQERIESKRWIINLKTTPRLLAIDGSTHCTGYAIYIDGKLTKYGYIYQSKSIKFDTKRIKHMKDELAKIINEYGINCVAMEDIIFKSKKALYSLSKLQGVICNYLYTNRIEYALITPREWKSAYDINRDDEFSSSNTRIESKEKTVACVNNDFGLNLQEEFGNIENDLSEEIYYDVSDAIAIGYIASRFRIKM